MSQCDHHGQDIQLSNLGVLGAHNTTASDATRDCASTNHVRLHADTQAIFRSRHVTMNTIGGAVGTGLMIGTGVALSKAGPAALLISYTAVGLIVFLVLCALGEMATWLPVSHTFTDHAVRFCDPALGFALGWTYWLKYLVVTPNQLTAGALVISYWLSPDHVSPGVWITVFLVVIILANCFAIRFIGEFEFWMSSFKVIIIIGLIILSLVLALGGGPDHDRKGFRYWKQPGAFAIAGSGRGHLARLAAVWMTIPSATFAYLGTELIGLTISQSDNPRKSTARAIKLTFYRILVFHILSAILLGMLIPYNSQHLAFAAHATESAAASAFVAAIQLAGISALPSILNACILLFVLEAANYSLFMATRTIYGLSQESKAPAFFSRTDRRGVPMYSLGVCSLLASLAYMSISHGSKVIFDHFVNLVTILGLLTWISILVTHISFVRARKVQKIRDEALAFKAPFGSFGSWVALIFCIVISLTKSIHLFDATAYPGEFDYRAFITSYLGIPVYLALMIGYKVATRCKRVNPEEADLLTGKLEFDRHEANPGNLKVERSQQKRRNRWIDKVTGAWLL